MDTENTYTSDVFDTPTPAGPPRHVLPFRERGDLTTVIIEQDYCVRTDRFLATYLAAIDSPCPFAPGFFLIDQGDARGEVGLTTFTRYWSKLPASRVDPEDYVFNPGSAGLGEYDEEQLWGVEFQEPGFDGVFTPPSTIPDDAEIINRESTGGLGGTTVVWNYRRFYDWRRSRYVKKGGFARDAALARTLISFVEVDYFHTSDPATITREASEQVVNDDGVLELPAGARRVVEEPKISRWRGNVWERRTRTLRGVT